MVKKIALVTLRTHAHTESSEASTGHLGVTFRGQLLKRMVNSDSAQLSNYTQLKTNGSLCRGSERGMTVLYRNLRKITSLFVFVHINFSCLLKTSHISFRGQWQLWKFLTTNFPNFILLSVPIIFSVRFLYEVHFWVRDKSDKLTKSRSLPNL